MFIHEHDDGSVTFTGSFYRQQWDEFLEGKGLPLSDEADGVPTGLSAKGEPELPPAHPEPEAEAPDAETVEQQPAGNASADEWRQFAVAQGADEDEVADLSRNDLRAQYGSED